MNIAIILDWVMSVMLIISITYSWRLNKRIIDFKNNKNEFFELIKVLDDTILRAEISIDELKNLTIQSSSSLGGRLDKAKFLANDLAFMTDRASLLADKLEEAIIMARNVETNQKSSFDFQRKNDYFNDYNKITSQKSTEPKKAAIESLLAKISAVRNKKEAANN